MPEPKITLSEMLAAIGNENVQLQFLSESLLGSQKVVKGVLRLTFETTAVNLRELVLEGTRMGLVLWINKDKWDEAARRLFPGGDLWLKARGIVRDPSATGHPRYTHTITGRAVVRQPHMDDVQWNEALIKFGEAHEGQTPDPTTEEHPA
jgi:hypothetical protein